MRDLWQAFVGPFVYLGLVGAWLTLEKLGGVHPMDPIGICVLLATPVTAGLFGGVLARGRRRWKALALGFPLLVALAGMFNGLCIGFMVAVTEPGHLLDVVQVAVMMGAICGVMFIPAMFWTFLSAVRIGGAREGSVLDVAFRRAPWAAAAASSAIAIWAVAYRANGERLAITQTGATLLAVNVTVLLSILAADLRALLRATKRARLAVLPVDPGSAHAAHAGEILDLGVGKELMAERLEGATTAYRDGGVRVTRLRGTIAVCRRKLLGVVAVDAVAT
jgi:hypothetical protein